MMLYFMRVMLMKKEKNSENTNLGKSQYCKNYVPSADVKFIIQHSVGKQQQNQIQVEFMSTTISITSC